MSLFKRVVESFFGHFVNIGHIMDFFEPNIGDIWKPYVLRRAWMERYNEDKMGFLI